MLFHESLESVTRKIEECFEGVSSVSRVFHRTLKGNSSKFQRWVSQVLGVLQKLFKEISRKLKDVLSVSVMFPDCFKISACLFCEFLKVV